MSSIPNTPGASQAAPSGTPSGASSGGKTENDLRDLDMDDFLQLLITELQNQDPMSPMENSEMVQQMATVREIGSTNKLTETLTDFSLTQQMTTASALIGQQVSGLAHDGEEVTGEVTRVSVETTSEDRNSRKVKVHVGEKTMEIRNVREIRTE